jgi:hypothetical protein
MDHKKMQEYVKRTTKELLGLVSDEISLDITMPPEQKAEMRTAVCAEIHRVIVEDIKRLVIKITKNIRVNIDFPEDIPKEKQEGLSVEQG